MTNNRKKRWMMETNGARFRGGFTALLVLASSFASVSMAESVAEEAEPATQAKPMDQADFQELVRNIQADTERLWGRAVGYDIEPKVMSRDQLAVMLDHLLKEELEKPEMKGAGEILRFLELIPNDATLEAIYTELLLGQIAGLFNPADSSLYVIDTFDPNSFLGNIILSHEIGHAIQDVYYDLASFLEDETVTDFQKAKQALIEGDATVLMSEWAGENFSAAAMLSLTQSISDQMGGLDSSPPALIQDLVFSYMAGAAFCTEAMQTIGPDWRRELFEDPPVSTEQVLHPEKYLSPQRDIPVEVSLAPLPEDSPYEEMFRNRYGEWAIRLFLTPTNEFPKITAYTLDPMVKFERAVNGASGWGGDEIVLISKDGDNASAIVWRTVWDTAEDAREFEQAALFRFSKFESLRGARGTDFGFGNDTKMVHHHRDELTVDLVIAADRDALDAGMALLTEKAK